jgi:hypothetical protein
MLTVVLLTLMLIFVLGANQMFLVRLVLLDLKVIKVHQVPKENKGHRGSREYQVRKDLQDLKVIKVTLVLQGEQGPPGDTHQTIVTLHDDAEGNAAGWNPGPRLVPDTFLIKSPVELRPSFSIEATFVNPLGNEIPGEDEIKAGQCRLFDIFDTPANTFEIRCGIDGILGGVPQDGAILKYIITK